jgi:hypothetical protein
MSSFRELPPSARRVIFGYVALGAFGVLLRVPEMRTWSWEDVAATAGLALAAALSEQFTVAMKHRTEALGLVQGRLQRRPVRRRHHRGGVRLPAVRSSFVVQPHDLRGVRRRHVLLFRHQ